MPEAVVAKAINSYDPDADLLDYCAICQRQEASQ